MIVTWTQPYQTSHYGKGLVHYGLTDLKQNEISIAEMEKFHQADIEYQTYRSALTNLQPNTTYCK